MGLLFQNIYSFLFKKFDKCMPIVPIPYLSHDSLKTSSSDVSCYNVITMLFSAAFIATTKNRGLLLNSPEHLMFLFNYSVLDHNPLVNEDADIQWFFPYKQTQCKRLDFCDAKYPPKPEVDGIWGEKANLTLLLFT